MFAVFNILIYLFQFLVVLVFDYDFKFTRRNLERDRSFSLIMVSFLHAFIVTPFWVASRVNQSAAFNILINLVSAIVSVISLILQLNSLNYFRIKKFGYSVACCNVLLFWESIAGIASNIDKRTMETLDFDYGIPILVILSAALIKIAKDRIVEKFSHTYFYKINDPHRAVLFIETLYQAHLNAEEHESRKFLMFQVSSHIR